MKSFAALGLMASVLSTVQAHSSLVGIYVDGEKQGDGTCVRMTKNKSHPVDPVLDLSSDDMACSFNGEDAAAYTCPAKTGSKLTFEYRSHPDKQGDGSIDPGHLGPNAIYAKQLSSADAAAAGSGWFKIWDDGYDVKTDTWAMTNFIADNGLLTIDVPEGLPAGNYLFRTELIAMHNASDTYVAPQFYPGCAQVFVESSTTGTLQIPSEYEASIPGYVDRSDPSMTYNIYQRTDAYPLAGPKAWVPPVSSSKSNKVVTQSSGGVPADCLVKNANWCATEVASYTDDQQGCWDSNSACWKEVDACWASAPITGGRNCEALSKKCKDIDSHCSSKDWTGPPEFQVENDDWPAYTSLPAAKNADDVASTADSPAPTSTQSAATTTTADPAPTTMATSTTSKAEDSKPTATAAETSTAEAAPTSTTETAPQPTKTGHSCRAKRHSHKRRNADKN